MENSLPCSTWFMNESLIIFHPKMAIFWFDTVFLKRPLPLRCTYTFCYKTFCEKLRYIVNSLRSTMYLRSLGLYSFARFCFWQIFNPDTYMNSKCQNILHKHRIRKLILRTWNEQKIRHSLTNKLDFWISGWILSEILFWVLKVNPKFHLRPLHFKKPI